MMQSGAIFSACRSYRYLLWRQWQKQGGTVLFIGLNPSTADARHDDPTITRCIGYARRWGYGGVCVANLFAYRTTYPQLLKAAPDPIGNDNDAWLVRCANQAALRVAAWGNDGDFQGRAAQVIRLLPPLHCLKMNKSGQPAHPLYQKGDLKPLPVPATLR